LSQKTPVCPHKSFPTIQFKVPLEVNELYQFTKIVFSTGSMAPIIYLFIYLFIYFRILFKKNKIYFKKKM